MRSFKGKKLLLIMLLVIVTMSFSSISFANTVEYKGEAEGLITVPDDFFLNFDTLMPGDIEEDVAYIKNSTDDKIEVFFRTEPLEKSEYYDDIDYSLLEQITLKISLKKTSSSEEIILYEGNLGAESMSEFISLGEYDKGFDGEFKFKIEVPTSLRNSYTLSRTKVKWIFAVEKHDEEKDDEKSEDKPENDSSKKNSSNANSTKTGDKIIAIVFALVITTLVCIITIVLKKKSSDKDEDNK